jgi:hypothetical protein
VTTTSNNGPVCEGAAASFSSTTVAGATYSWSGPNGFTSNLQNPSIPSTTIADAGTYTLTVTASGCSTSSSTTLGVNPNPVADAGSDVSICSGGTTTLIGNGGVNYSWSPATGLSSTGSASTNASPSSPTPILCQLLMQTDARIQMM